MSSDRRAKRPKRNTGKPKAAGRQRHQADGRVPAVTVTRDGNSLTFAEGELVSISGPDEEGNGLLMQFYLQQ